MRYYTEYKSGKDCCLSYGSTRSTNAPFHVRPLHSPNHKSFFTHATGRAHPPQQLPASLSAAPRQSQARQPGRAGTDGTLQRVAHQPSPPPQLAGVEALARAGSSAGVRGAAMGSEAGVAGRAGVSSGRSGSASPAARPEGPAGGCGSWAGGDETSLGGPGRH